MMLGEHRAEPLTLTGLPRRLEEDIQQGSLCVPSRCDGMGGWLVRNADSAGCLMLGFG